MKKYLPFLFLFAGVFAIFGVLFLLVRFDAVPASVRSLHWGMPSRTEAEEPVEEATV